MKKRLLLTLLPLTFLVAACSGASDEAKSEASKAAQSSSAAAATTSQAATTSEADTSSAASQDARAKTEPAAEGYSVKVGDYYYELDVQNTDEGRKESYNITNLEFTAGQKVSVYKDGGTTALSVWANADETNGLYPNYDERPQSEQYTEFTITVSDTGNIYFHVNTDDSYAIWITPAQSSSGSDTPSGGGTAPEGAPTTGFAICVNGTSYYSLTNEGEWDMDKSFTQYSITTGVELAAGDHITFYNADENVSWGTMKIDPASQGGLTQEEGYLNVGTAGTYDIYVKMKYQQDNIYMGPHSA